MVSLRSFRNIFSIAELRGKILFTLGVLIVYRIGYAIPVIGVDVAKLGEFMRQATTLSGFFSYLDTFSGSRLTGATLFSLGISPYITASIMMQLLGMTIPSLERLTKEGDYGRKIIAQYTRYLTLALSISYSFTYASVLQSYDLVVAPGLGFKFLFVASLTAGAMLVMWMGDQIAMFGVGNGSSMIIFAGIVSHFPSYVTRSYMYLVERRIDPIALAVLLAIFLLIIACIVYLEKGERKIPVQYARRVVGNRVYGGQSSYIPFKINPVGVMPVIYANAAFSIPVMLSKFLGSYFPSLKFLTDIFAYNTPVFIVLNFLLIVFFMYLSTAMFLNSDELAENIKKSGGFIPGIRPGKRTAQFFDFILNRIGLVGAMYLGLLAIIPNIIYMVMNDTPFIGLSGTSLLIIVGVALELAAQLESYLIEHRYEGFLSTGRMKSRYAR